MEPFASPPPKVTLEAVIRDPYDLAVATARTCYSAKGVIRVPDVNKDEKSRALRDKIAQTTRDAGHLTTRQHAHFVFSMENVSRQFLWSFLHSHPFYNSEQVSQRYVKVSKGHYTVPPMDEGQKRVYEEIIAAQMADYETLIEILLPKVKEEYFQIFPVRRKYLDRYEPVLKKKSYEVARYVLPVATHAYLYHTVSALTLMRYHRLMDCYDVPWEQRLVVEQMIEAVKALDPEFQRELSDPVRPEETPEYRWLQAFQEKTSVHEDYLREFDASLEGRYAVLTDYKAHAPQTLANSVRSVLGITRSQLSDEHAIDAVLDPAQNRFLADTLNVNTLSKLSRTLFHVHYTFRKKISHTADSQDQRHRMTPASRPMLEAHYTGKPDYIVPLMIRDNEEALEVYRRSMENTFSGINRLIDMGLKKEFALYLLPNSFPIRFEESGDLLNLHHKWHTRACYTAQEEIFYATMDELIAVKAVHPTLVRHILAPCYIRKHAGVKPICPEGERFCGVKVWEKEIEDYQRVI
ncbi:MAG: FAD-dependent thymidylate synthase [Deltaproteobacteria bacterium]|nr:FAD-dependent thymidylate synthase [Deltaproteobacteria bacterium]